jgi:Kef-type K+ transport system membrane component KefB
MKKLVFKAFLQALFFTVFVSVFGYFYDENISFSKYLQSESQAFIIMLPIMFAVYFVLEYFQFKSEQRKENLRNHHKKTENDFI